METWELFHLIGYTYFKTKNSQMSSQESALLDKIFDSDFYQIGFEQFREEKLLEKGQNVSQSEVFLYNALSEVSPEYLPPYSNVTRQVSGLGNGLQD